MVHAQIRNNKDLLSMKVFGYSNLRNFFILALTSFILGWIILFVANPVTSLMTKYYEKTKSNYSRDIDHLVTFTKNGLWIKENILNGERIISAEKPDGFELINVTIFHLDKNYLLKEKIVADKADIKENIWKLQDVQLFKSKNGIFNREKLKTYKINSIYNYDKINSLFKNFDTMSF